MVAAAASEIGADACYQRPALAGTFGEPFDEAFHLPLHRKPSTEDSLHCATLAVVAAAVVLAVVVAVLAVVGGTEMNTTAAVRVAVESERAFVGQDNSMPEETSDSHSTTFQTEKKMTVNVSDTNLWARNSALQTSKTNKIWR